MDKKTYFEKCKTNNFKLIEQIKNEKIKSYLLKEYEEKIIYDLNSCLEINRILLDLYKK